MTKTIEIGEVKNQINELIDSARHGDEIIITADHEPIVRILSIKPPKKERIPDLGKGEVWMSDDFNDPLPDEFWTGTE